LGENQSNKSDGILNHSKKKMNVKNGEGGSAKSFYNRSGGMERKKTFSSLSSYQG
jgi:hypothetical protein